MSQTVVLDWNEKMHLTATGPGGTIEIDAAEEYGGEGNGLRPKALMLTALGGCAGLDIASLLKKMRAEVQNFKIEVTGQLTEEHPKYYDKVAMTFKFYDKEFDKDKIQKCVDLSVERYCGVMEMFRQFSEVKVAVEYHTI